MGSGAGSPGGCGGGGGVQGDAGKKMMHHCHICNRGFLNKSNIKVRFELKKIFGIEINFLYSRFTYEHTQERSLSAVSTAARRSDRRLTFSSTCPYTSESPGTNV